MLNSGKKNCALRDKKNKYSNSCVVRKNVFERNKKPYPPPLQVKWSIPKSSLVLSHRNNKQKHEGYSRNTCRVLYI